VERYIESTALASLSATCELCTSRNWEAEGAGAWTPAIYVHREGLEYRPCSQGEGRREGVQRANFCCSLGVCLLLFACAPAPTEPES
jgi:hypothetical protein